MRVPIEGYPSKWSNLVSLYNFPYAHGWINRVSLGGAGGSALTALSALAPGHWHFRVPSPRTLITTTNPHTGLSHLAAGPISYGQEERDMQDPIAEAVKRAVEYGAPPLTLEVGPDAKIALANGNGHMLDGATITTHWTSD